MFLCVFLNIVYSMFNLVYLKLPASGLLIAQLEDFVDENQKKKYYLLQSNENLHQKGNILSNKYVQKTCFGIR